jgi:hypothetical protein
MERISSVITTLRRLSPFGVLSWSLTLALGGSFACGDDPHGGNGDNGGADAVFAVIRSDFSTTAIATLRADGSILDPAVLDSGSRPPGLVATLSGDVVLANASRGEAGVLNILDRFQTDVVTRYDLASEEVVGQLRVKDGFPTNPQDLAIVDDSRAWVSRFGVNLEEGEPVIDQANDVLEIDPSTMELTGRRLGFDRFTTSVTVMRDEGPVEVDVFARPSSMTLVESTLVVGLSLLSFQFDAASPGKVGLVDVDARTLDEFSLPDESRNCGALRAVPNAPDSVLVACRGFARPFGEEAPGAGFIRRVPAGVRRRRSRDREILGTARRAASPRGAKRHPAGFESVRRRRPWCVRRQPVWRRSLHRRPRHGRQHVSLPDR